MILEFVEIDVGRFVIKREPWSMFAKCSLDGVPTSWFFPTSGVPGRSRDIAAYCEGCAVRADCLAYGLSLSDETFGYFGGVRLLRREERRAASALLRELRAEGS